jgi:Phosphorylase superfamily
MHLITMAHHGEAQSVIEKLKLEKAGSDLFKNETMILLLTGEGPFEAATKTALTLSKFPFTEVINLGIAGSLSSELEKGSFIAVRTIYLIQNLRPEFRTFQCSQEGVDCLTSFERILDPEKAKGLKGIGKIVDREAWGVAMAARVSGLPFRVYKVISDVAGTIGACEVVTDEAPVFSDKLAEGLMSVLNIKKEKEKFTELQGFHMTFSQKHRFETLLLKLMIKNELSAEAVISSLELEKFTVLEITPKEKTKRLLEKMEDMIDPVRKILVTEGHRLTQEFQTKGFKLSFDQNWETPRVTVSFEARNDSDLHEKALALQKLSLSSFARLMNGEFNVE